MGTIEQLLDCISPTDLGEVLRERVPGIKLPRAGKERVALVAECIADGRLSLDAVLDVTKGQKDWLIELCEKVGVDAEGTIGELRGRIHRWYASKYGKSAPVRTDGKHQPTSSAQNLLAFSRSERQFIEVTAAIPRRDEVAETVDAIAGGLMRWVTNTEKPTAVLPIHDSPGALAGVAFPPGHPVRNTVYFLDPFADDKYLLAEDAARRVMERKISALTMIAACLGASRVEVVAVKTSEGTASSNATISALGKEIGLERMMSDGHSSTDRIAVEWPSSELKEIPAEYLPYLEAMEDLRVLAQLVKAGKQPSSMQRQVTIDSHQSREIAGKVAKLAKVSAGAKRSEFRSASWTFEIWFARVAGPQPSSGSSGAAAMSQEQIMATLKQLGELMAVGLLTEAEFNAKKRELLARL